MKSLLYIVEQSITLNPLPYEVMYDQRLQIFEIRIIRAHALFFKKEYRIT